MNHDFIRAQDIQARYAAGKLAADEEAAFESHLVECAECAEAVDVEIGLREGLRTVATERPEFATTRATRAPTSRAPASRPYMQLAAAALLLVAAGSSFVALRSSAALQRARAAQAALDERARGAETSAAALRQQLSELQRQSTEASQTKPNPVTSVAVFALSTVRSGSSSEPSINQVRLDSTMARVVLTVDVPGAGVYAIALKDRAGKEVWSGGDFKPAADDTLAVAVERTVLASGDYLLELSKQTSADRVALISRYSFRVTIR